MSPSAQPRYQTAANLVLVSACLFVLGSIFQIVATNIEHGNEWNDKSIFTHPLGGKDHEPWTEEERQRHYTARINSLNDGAVLKKRWDNRRRSKAPYFLGMFPTMAGWFAALPAVEALTNVLGGASRSGTSFVRYSFGVAAFLTIIEFSAEAGTASTTDGISTWPQVLAATDNATVCTTADGEYRDCFGPIQALEMAYFVAKSRTLWLYAMDRFLLFLALLATAGLVYSSSIKHISNGFGHLSAVVSIFCLVGFVIEISRFVQWREAAAGLVFSHVMIDMLLVPLWFIVLACQLRSVSHSSNARAMEKEWGRAHESGDMQGHREHEMMPSRHAATGTPSSPGDPEAARASVDDTDMRI